MTASMGTPSPPDPLANRTEQPITTYIPERERVELAANATTLLELFCKGCPQCGGSSDVDSFPDCLGDGDSSPSGHMPACDLCIEAYQLMAAITSETKIRFLAVHRFADPTGTGCDLCTAGGPLS